MKKLFPVLLGALALALAFALCVTTAAAADLSGYYYGDVDGNGKVNSSDARQILRCAAKLSSLDETWAPLGDINSDGKVNSTDGRLALRLAAKLENLAFYGQGFHAHSFAPATITTPKTCTVCGATEGKPLSAQMRLLPTVTSVSMKRGGTAIINVEELFPDAAYEEPFTVRAESDSDAVAVFWLQDADDNFTKYIRIHADGNVQNAQVKVYVLQAPEVCTTIRVSVGSSGSGNYTGKGPFLAVPDYGCYLDSSASTALYSSHENGGEGFHYYYRYNDLANAGYSDTTLFDGFDAKLKAAGFEYAGKLENGGLFYQKDEITVTFIYYTKSDTVEIAVYG